MLYVNAADEHKGIKIDLTIFTMSCLSFYHLTRASRSTYNNTESTIDKIILQVYSHQQIQKFHSF